MLPITADYANQLQLTPLPPLKASPGYEIVGGEPRASVHFELGQWDSKLRLGVWGCSAGAFRCEESGDELQTLTMGRLRLVREDGSSEEFVAGDAIHTVKGEVLIWDVIEPVRKVFFTYNIDGV